MNQKIDYKQIAKYLAGECSEKEAAELKARAEADPEFEKMVSGLRQVWDARSSAKVPWNIEATWHQLSTEMDEFDKTRKQKKQLPDQVFTMPKTVIRNQWWVRVAAVFAVIGFITLFSIYHFSTGQHDGQRVAKEVATEKGQRAQIQLTDGSRVHLNSGSRLTYPEEFEPDNRIVELTGEAYFDIAGEGRPFFVYADKAVIQIIGTEFNVQAYDDEIDIKVVVADGKVNVRYNGAPDDESVFLERGDMASLQRNDPEVLSIEYDVNLDRHLGWLEYRLTFNDEPLEQVARKLERWYNIDIIFADPELSKRTLSATFEDETIHEVLRVLELALELDYEISGRTITFLPSDH